MKSLIAILSLSILIFSNVNLAQAKSSNPSFKLCIDKKCRTPYQIKISHKSWSEVKAMFSSAFTTDKDEQDSIVSAIGIIENDIYHSLAKLPSQTLSANDLYVSNSVKNNYRNIKNILSILLDRYLIKHHLMRKTITSTNWLGVDKTALLLQSLNTSKLYILESYGTELGNSAAIEDYKKTSDLFELDNDQTSNTLDNDDFE